MLTEMQGSNTPDLSHHLSREARERLPNAMKTFFRSLQDAPSLTSLANGDPHPSIYPLAQVDFHVPDASTLGIVSSWLDRSAPTQTLSAFNGGRKSAIDLAVAMQYGTGLGLGALRERFAQLNELLHHPHVTTRSIVLTLGNADAVTKLYRLLGTPGDTFLVEEYSFCGLTNAPIAQGVKWQPVKIDDQGLIPEAMEAILSDWDETVRGRKPHVLYCIPTGHNPTGVTIPLERRHAIYAIAQKHDVIILEDGEMHLTCKDLRALRHWFRSQDPYLFVQYQASSPSHRAADVIISESTFLKSLVPSFLSLDVDGRVVRLDTVSKTVAPNMRLGWITCNALFSRKLEILTDNSTQHPHGLGQSFMAEILSPNGWGMEGYLRWAWGIRNEYQRRRDLFFDTFQREIGTKGHASTKLPLAGMFFWIQILVEHHPRYAMVNPVPKKGPKTNANELMDELFHLCVKDGLLIMPGGLFAMQTTDRTVSEESSIEGHILDRAYFRATFVGMDDTITKALKILGSTLTQFFKE